MKILSIILIISTIVMGYFDGGNMTAALILAVLFGPAIFGTGRNKKAGR